MHLVQLNAAELRHARVRTHTLALQADGPLILVVMLCYILQGVTMGGGVGKEHTEAPYISYNSV